MTRRRSGRPTAPWSDKGWYGDQSRRRISPEIRQLIEQEGRGRWNPVLYYEGRAALAWSPAFHNPYFAAGIGAGFLAIAVFLFVQMRGVPWLAALVGGLFFVASVTIVALNIRRVPSWHRARRSVRNHIARHGGTFPYELRWYT